MLIKSDDYKSIGGNNKNLLFIVFCLFISFEDTLLGRIGGVLTANPSFFVVIFSVIFSFILKGRVFGSAIIITYILASIIHSIIYYLLFFNHYELSFAIDRGARFFLLNLSLFLGYFYIRRVNSESLRIGIIIISLIVLFSLFLNLSFPEFINNKSIFHLSDFSSVNRLRGFSSEASTYGFQIITIAILYDICVKKIPTTILIPLLITLSLLTTSKGAFLTILGATLLYFFIMANFYQKVLLIIVFLITITSASQFILILFQSSLADIETFTSVATRSTLLLTAIYSLFYNPLGTGFMGYLPSIYENGPIAAEYLNSFYPMNFSEVSEYFVVGTVKNVGTKSIFFDQVIFWGYLFIIPFFYFNYKLLRYFIRSKDISSFILLTSTLIAITTYISNYSCYFLPLIYAVLVNKYNQRDLS